MAPTLLPQRAFAAFLAMSRRLFADSFLALALPPFKPPLRPTCARYSEICERSDWVSVTSSGSCVGSRTISAAKSIRVFGLMLERLMHTVCHNPKGGFKNFEQPYNRWSYA